MGYDNRLLNMNGQSDAQLLLALQFAFMDQYKEPNTCKAWEFIPSKGLVLYQYHSDSWPVNKFPAPTTADDVMPMVKKWLLSDEAKQVPLCDWEGDIDHDGCNVKGWRVYLEDWGHIESRWGALCCIKPVYLWLGK